VLVWGGVEEHRSESQLETENLSGVVNFFVDGRGFGAPLKPVDRGVVPSFHPRIKVQPLLPHHSPLTPSILTQTSVHYLHVIKMSNTPLPSSFDGDKYISLSFLASNWT
jgi:hypothetical protein